MKRTYLSLLLCSVLTFPAMAQLAVDSRGNVGVKRTDEFINSLFSVNTQGDSKICTIIKSDSSCFDTGLRIVKSGLSNTVNDYAKGISCDAFKATTSFKKLTGVYSIARNDNGIDSNKGRSYGIYAMAGNSTDGWNYGVLGTLYGNKYGAGIFGSSVEWDGGMSTGDKYAGFFHGKVKSTDAMYATVYNTISDARFKDNIEPIEFKAINEILKLNVVKYDLKQFSVNDTDTSTVQMYYYTDESLLERKHYGLIAQELQEIFPDLVYEGADGYLSVNYIELIPFLIKSIQELKAELNDMKGSSKESPIRSDKSIQTAPSLLTASLYQNNPNPFTETTTIKCFVPHDITNAVMYFYDMNGRQIDSKLLFERGDVSLVIEGGSLDAGIYLYSLITDGTVVDTKRMILTK